MAEYLRLTQELIEESVNAYREQLTKGIVYGNKPIIPKLKKLDLKTKLYFDINAYQKMRYIVNNCDKEVAWHGTVERVEDGFKVTDILLYPQLVTGATVDTDEKEYTNWLTGLGDDVFNSLRFHGHSHVRMATSPSATDEDNRKEFISKIGNDGFYIFFITNKAGDFSVRIYDARANAVYDKEDVTVIAFEGREQIDADLKRFVREKSFERKESAKLPKASAAKTSKALKTAGKSRKSKTEIGTVRDLVDMADDDDDDDNSEYGYPLSPEDYEVMRDDARYYQARREYTRQYDPRYYGYGSDLYSGSYCKSNYGSKY